MQHSSQSPATSIADHTFQAVGDLGDTLFAFAKKAGGVIGRSSRSRAKLPNAIEDPLLGGDELGGQAAKAKGDDDLSGIDELEDEAALGGAVWFDVPGDGSCGLHAMLAYAIFSWSMVGKNKSISDDSVLAVFNRVAMQKSTRYVLKSMREHGGISDELLGSGEYQAVLEAFVTAYKTNQKRKELEAKHIEQLKQATGIQDGKFQDGECYFEFERHVASLANKQTADSNVWITSKDIEVLREVIHNEQIPENDAIVPLHRGQHWMLQIQRNSNLLDKKVLDQARSRSAEVERARTINQHLQDEGTFDKAYQITYHFQSWTSRDSKITIRRAKQAGVTAHFEETDAQRAGQYAMQQYLSHQCPYTDEQLQEWSSKGELHNHITITGSDAFCQAAQEAISTYLRMDIQAGNVGHKPQVSKHGLFSQRDPTTPAAQNKSVDLKKFFDNRRKSLQSKP